MQMQMHSSWFRIAGPEGTTNKRIVCVGTGPRYQTRESGVRHCSLSRMLQLTTTDTDANGSRWAHFEFLAASRPTPLPLS